MVITQVDMDDPRPSAKLIMEKNTKSSDVGKIRDPNIPGIIYKITLPANSVPLDESNHHGPDQWSHHNRSYIGQTVKLFGARMSNHKSASINPQTHGCRLLYNAVRKYGWDAFTKEILFHCPGWMLDMYETKFIEMYDTLAPRGFNLETGGHLNKKHSDETKRLIASLKLGTKHTEETKKKLSVIHSARSDEYKDKLSMASRQSEDSKKLHRNIVKADNNSRHGYIIKKHPQCQYKSFTDSSLTDEENRQKALTFFEDLKAGKVTVTPRVKPAHIPLGMYQGEKGYYIDYRRLNDIRVRKMFCDQSIPLDERLAEAKFQLEWIKLEDDFPEGFDFEKYFWELLCAETELVSDGIGDAVIYDNLDDLDDFE